MSIPMQLLLVVAAFCVCFSEGAPDGRIARAKQQRPTRGFKNLEMMTARGFGKRGRPSPRTEPDDEDPALLQRTYRIPVFKTTPKFAYANGKRTAEMEPEALEANFGDHAPLQRTYRTPTFKSSTQNYAYGHGKRSTEIESKDAQEAAVDQSTLDRTYSTPSFNTKSRNFAYGPGKRATEKEFEADFADQSLLQRTYRTPTFKSSTQNYAYGHGKRATEIDSKADIGDQAPPQRTYRTPIFKSAKQTYAYGHGKRTTEIESKGDFEDELLPERQRTAVPATHVFKTSVPAVTARDYEKRMPEIVPEESYRRYNPKSSMMVATDFGKRSYDETSEEEEEYRMRRTDFKSKNIVRVAIGYGKREPIKRVYGLDNFWETLASPEREGQEMDDEKLESIPMDWFVNEIVNNPDFARSVLRKFVDINQDGMLSSDELLRNV